MVAPMEPQRLRVGPKPAPVSKSCGSPGWKLRTARAISTATVPPSTRKETRATVPQRFSLPPPTAFWATAPPLMSRTVYRPPAVEVC